MPSRLNDHPRAHETVTLSEAQFDELKALLAPGAELAALMLADYKTKAAAASEPATPAQPDAGAD